MSNDRFAINMRMRGSGTRARSCLGLGGISESAKRFRVNTLEHSSKGQTRKCMAGKGHTRKYLQLL